MKLNEKIIKLRKENGLSQEEFGEKINVSRQAVSKWESEQSVPELDKIKEIAITFNLSYDYLLNDEIEEIVSSNENSNNKTSNKKSFFKKIIKVILVLLVIYLIYVIYNFIAFTRFYLIANSFSEENWSYSVNMQVDSLNENELGISYITTKCGDEITNKTYFLEKDEQPVYPNVISYINLKDVTKSYKLLYYKPDNIYQYQKEELIDIDEKEYLKNASNSLKQYTLDTLPSNFLQMLYCSFNPFINVNIFTRTITMENEGDSTRVKLNNDCLISKITLISKYDCYTRKVNVSYDYMPEHFIDRKLENFLEKYKDMIKYE